MTQTITTDHTNALAQMRRFTLSNCGEYWIAKHNGRECLTLSRTKNGLVYAHAVATKYDVIADLINRADVPADRILVTEEPTSTDSEGDFRLL